MVRMIPGLADVKLVGVAPIMLRPVHALAGNEESKRMLSRHFKRARVRGVSEVCTQCGVRSGCSQARTLEVKVDGAAAMALEARSSKSRPSREKNKIAVK